jgi:hypothetical protein
MSETIMAEPQRANGNRILRVCCAASTAFVVTALVVGACNALSPFEQGWWLAAFLFLVGGASQFLLGGGQFVVAARRHAAAPARALSWIQLALWNSGTAAVAGADMAHVLPGVAAGSTILIIALVLFLAGLLQTGRTARRRSAALERGYLTLLVLLAGCVILGTFLAGAAPGQ